MSNVNTDGLPPEMQARIAQIIEGAKQKAIAEAGVEPTQQAPVAPPVSTNLMDHTIALRQEVAAMRHSQCHGRDQAVGQKAAVCHVSTANHSYGSSPTYSSQQDQVDVGMTTDKPYRIQTPSGYRKYLCSGLYMPSVTTVLSATETEKSKASLRTWQANNPGALEEASTRGSAIHLGCENYLRGLDPGVPEEYQDFWNGLSQYLDWFDVLHWSERPLRPDWNHLRSDDREVAYVWSTEHMYAGSLT